MKGCSPHEIEDLMQEIAIIAFENLHTLEKDFGDWVKGITRNAYKDYVKRTVRQRNRESEFGVKMFEDDRHSNLENQIISREYVRAILGDLKPLDRECMEYHFVNGLTLEKTAENLKISTSGVHYHIESAIKQIREKLLKSQTSSSGKVNQDV